jgi:hypothetical protein
MSKIKIDLNELVISFGFDDEELATEYLDREAGYIINIPRRVMKVAGGELDESDLDDWEKELLIDAKTILEDMKDRYLVIPTIESQYFYEAMKSFVEEIIKDTKIKEEAFNALTLGNPMRQFKNAISNYEEIQSLWYDYEDRKSKEYAVKWLQDNNIQFEEV